MRSKLLVHEFLLCHVALLLTLLVKEGSSSIVQAPVQPLSHSRILNFDDIETDGGWGEVPSKYGSLHFEGFYVFKPTDPEIERVISENDLNCATSKPNALYGTRFNFEEDPNPPFITTAPRFSQANKTTVGDLTSSSDQPPASFELESLKVKALDMPFAYTTLSLRGHQLNDDDEDCGGDGATTLEWAVDFPAGYHDMFKVDIEAFSGQKWSNLTKLEIWADFHDDDNGIVLDWEYCFDDLQVRFDSG